MQSTVPFTIVPLPVASCLISSQPVNWGKLGLQPKAAPLNPELFALPTG